MSDKKEEKKDDKKVETKKRPLTKAELTKLKEKEEYEAAHSAVAAKLRQICVFSLAFFTTPVAHLSPFFLYTFRQQ
jgi:hypothetical protein